ncbi:MAG: toxin-antitoxin system YwqK family antitoxin [Elusimicrobia bacterium]|nr:toxin-antitoxin system YwqK family antitoxin [Elusimicrobiota bacterium]
MNLCPAILLISILGAWAAAEVTVIVRKDAKGAGTRIFFQDGEEIARSADAAFRAADPEGRPLGRLEGHVPTGEVREYHPNGRLKTLFRAINEADGTLSTCILEEYRPNGKMAFKAERDGCASRLVIEFHPSGLPKIIANWAHGTPEGPSTHYYDDTRGRKRVMMETFYRGGLRDGVERMYYRDGSLWSEGRYKEDKREGKEVAYNDDGDGGRTEREYRADEQVGFERSYDKRGKLYSEIPYAGGQRDGTWKVFSSGGVALLYEIVFKKGKLDGESRSYDENGKGLLRCILTYRDGTLVKRQAFDGAGTPLPGKDRAYCSSLERYPK